MKTTLIASLLAPLALLLAGGASGENPQLVGTVGAGDAFVITLTDASGQPVTKLDPGTYTLLVHDLSTLHNFHLVGPGVDATTTVDGTGDRTFTVTFTDGEYQFFCDPHATRMRGTFTVGTPPPPPPPPPPPAPPAARKLSASVGPGASLSLSAKAVPAGDYRLTVRDRSKTRNFHLVGPGVNRRTTKAFVGTVTWSVALQPGTYRYGSDPKLTRKLRVT